MLIGVNGGRPLSQRQVFFGVWVTKLIRLNALRILRQAEYPAWHWVLYANPWNICPPETHEQVSALNAKHHTVCLKLMPFPKMPCSGVA